MGNFVGMCKFYFMNMAKFRGYEQFLWIWKKFMGMKLWLWKNFIGYVMSNHGKFFCGYDFGHVGIFSLWFCTCRNFLWAFWACRRIFYSYFGLGHVGIFYGYFGHVGKFLMVILDMGILLLLVMVKFWWVIDFFRRMIFVHGKFLLVWNEIFVGMRIFGILMIG